MPSEKLALEGLGCQGGLSVKWLSLELLPSRLCVQAVLLSRELVSHDSGFTHASTHICTANVALQPTPPSSSLSLSHTAHRKPSQGDVDWLLLASHSFCLFCSFLDVMPDVHFSFPSKFVHQRLMFSFLLFVIVHFFLFLMLKRFSIF